MLVIAENGSLAQWCRLIPDSKDKELLAQEQKFLTSVCQNTEDWDAYPDPMGEGIKVKLTHLDIPVLLNLLAKREIPVSIKYGD